MLNFSTYLGGDEPANFHSADSGYGIAVSAPGEIFVTGLTEATNFPTVNPFQPTKAGATNAFITHIYDAGSGPPPGTHPADFIPLIRR